MITTQIVRSTSRGLVFGAGLAAAAYATYAATMWLRYGHAQPGAGADQDPLLDRFIPTYELLNGTTSAWRRRQT